MISGTNILKISDVLTNNGVIAFPTDTVWGVGCLVDSPLGVDRIYKMKGRDAGKPLILLGSKLENLLPYVENFPQRAKQLAEKYFPGALTLVLPKSFKTPDYITSGYNTVGIRIPDHPVFLEMLNKTGKVLATTSANISGEGAFANKEDVEISVGSEVDYILDDYGYAAGGKESTVISVDMNNSVKILRQGAVEL